MTTGMVRALIGVVAFVVGVAVGWLAHRQSAPPPGTEKPGGAQVVVVGPTAADVHPPRVTLSRGNRDVLFWIGTSPGKQLFIESEQQLFENQERVASGRYQVTCARRMCFSDEILAAAADGEYKYWQVFREPGQPDDVADGWIIIDR